MTNIALVVLDTLRKDAFDRHFEWLPGRRFEHAYTTANWTVPAHASLFTGRYASEVGVHAKNLYCDCAEPTLAEELRSAGYTTRAFSANTNITEHFDFDRGFTDFRTPERFGGPSGENVFNWREFTRTTTATGVRKYLKALAECFGPDVATVPSLIAGFKLGLNEATSVKYGGAIEALAEIRDIDFGDQEFFFCNLMDAHEPYKAPEEYMTVEEPPLTEAIGDIDIGALDRSQLPQAYDDCAGYLSDVYEEIVEALSADFEYIITLSDHGELLGEHGAWGHEHGVYPELTHVPLCISGDGLDDERTGPASILDVHRTVLELAGVDGDSRGRYLLDDDDGQEYLTEYRGLTPWSERKLETKGYEDRIERYDETLYGYVAAPQYYGYETTDGFEETSVERDTDPQRRLAGLVDDLDIKSVEGSGEVPEAVRDQLEQLGYA